MPAEIHPGSETRRRPRWMWLAALAFVVWSAVAAYWWMTMCSGPHPHEFVGVWRLKTPIDGRQATRFDFRADGSMFTYSTPHDQVFQTWWAEDGKLSITTPDTSGKNGAFGLKALISTISDPCSTTRTVLFRVVRSKDQMELTPVEEWGQSVANARVEILVRDQRQP